MFPEDVELPFDMDRTCFFRLNFQEDERMKSTKDGRPRNAWVTTNSKARQGVRKNPHVVAHLSAEIRNVCLDNITLYQTSFTLPNQTLLVMFVAHLGNLILAQPRKYVNLMIWTVPF